MIRNYTQPKVKSLIKIHWSLNLAKKKTSKKWIFEFVCVNQYSLIYKNSTIDIKIDLSVWTEFENNFKINKN